MISKHNSRSLVLASGSAYRAALLARLRLAFDVCTVHFRRLTMRQIEHYVDLEQPYDCAGSFKSEGLGIALFTAIETTDPNGLIGLPLIRLVDLLAEFGVDVL